MPILDNDIKILASQVLADVPEGGGAATGIVVADGVSNNLFPDVSELDHVYGRVALRKVFVSVQTASRDVFMGAHAIIADEPDDPGVSCLLFSTNDAFDTRTAAKNRIESYLIQGPAYPGQLFGDHIAGQMTVALVQREETPIPSVGETVLLRSNEGLATQSEQFLRVLDRTVTVRTFTDDKGDFKRAIVTLSVSDQLRADHRGFSAGRFDSSVDFAGKAKVYQTTVADAARYYGVKPLLAPVGAGDRTISADGIFVPLVPSSRTEIGIADARMNQQSAALQAGTSAPITITSTATIFTAASALYIGGGILPGSLGLTVSDTLLTDSGGRLMSGSTSVGIVDYANGIASLATNLFGTGPVNVSATYSPCAPVQIASESVGIEVTAATRRLTWVLPVVPAPAPGSLQVSYRSQGRWYVLSEDGSGAVRGTDASFGAGSLNYTTGTLSLTLGSLPDVPSSILLAWAPTSAVSPAPLLPETGVPRAVGEPLPSVPAPAPTSKARAALALGTAAGGILPGSLSLAWDGKTSTDGVGTGFLAGDAGGVVDYSGASVSFCPSVLPAKGTVVTATYTAAPRGTTTDFTLNGFGDAGANYTASLVGALPVRARSFSATISARGTQRVYPGVDQTFDTGIRIADDGAGKLVYGAIQVGTIDYLTGALTLVKSFQQNQQDSVFQEVSIDGTPGGPKRTAITGVQNRTVAVPILNSGNPFQQGLALVARWVSGTATQVTVTAAVDSLMILGDLGPGKAQSLAVAFHLGTSRLCSRADGIVSENPAMAPSGGTVRGQVLPVGYVRLDSWAAGLQNTVSNWVASSGPTETAQVGASLVDTIAFRIAAAPVAPSGFSISGKDRNGAAIAGVSNATGDITGSGITSGSINYETGVVTIKFAVQARADSLRYNAVAYSYIPLDSNVLGLDPVRLPTDGRVPVFRNGGVAVIHHTQVSAPMTVTAGQTVNLGRTNVGQVTVIGANGTAAVGGYTVDRAAGTVNFTAVPASQPIKIRDRIEEAALMTDVQISGLVKLNRPLSRAYPAGSKVSSALLAGDMAARVSLFFDQETWTGVWSDNQIGNAAGPTFDTINYPAEVQNAGAVTERWALKFNGSTSFTIVGEHLGQIGVGNTASDCMPINPATGTPYFKLDKRGFNAGWSVDNVLRLNTIGAAAPLWLARVVQQGTPVLASDSFTLAVRGDVDTL